MKKVMSILITLIAASFAMAAQPMLHFELLDSSQGGEPTEIKLNLPLSMLNTMSEQFNQAIDEIDLDGQEIDLRAIWQEVKNVGPNEYVQIKGEDGNISVSTTGTHILVNINEKDQDIEVKVPYQVAEILFGTEHPDLNNLVDSLLEMRGEDLVSIRGTQMTGRLWID